MKRNGKIGVLAALLCVCLALTFVPTVSAAAPAPATGFNSNLVEVKGENEAMKGWMYYFYNTTLGGYYHSNDLFVRATENGRTGNALEVERKKADDQLILYSYPITVEPNTTYNISSFVKIANSDGKLVYMVKEIDENGTAVGDENEVRNTVSGALSDWTATSFNHVTTATTKTIVLRIRAEGTGIMDIDDVTVEKVYTNTVSYRLMGIGNDGTETPASYAEITADDIVSDSSDGDGKALRLDDKDVLIATLGMLPHGYNYEVTFKYKSVSGQRMSFYLDNVNPSGARVWYADAISGGSATEWTSYSYKFSAVEKQTDVVYFRLTSYGTYYIDELEIKSLNEYVLNGSFENAYYGYLKIANSSSDIDGNRTDIFTDATVLSASNISTDSADGDGKSVKLSANDYLNVTYAPKKLDDNKTYTLSFKYKKLDSASGSYIRTRLDHVTVAGPQGWYGPNGDQGVEGEWVTYSFDFTTNANPENQYVSAKFVTISAQGGEFLIDDISIKCKTFDDMQYMPNGSFSGAYTAEYQLYNNFNVAKQSDGTYVFVASSVTHAFGSSSAYMRLDAMSSLPTGKEYTLSFDYRSGGAEAVRVFYGIGWSNETLPLTNILTCTQAISAAWVHKEVTFTHNYSNAFLEIYGDSSAGWPSYIKNIQITNSETGETYITNQSLVAPNGLIYSSDFGTGSAEYTWNDWTIENGEIRGLNFDDGGTDWKICLNGTAEKAAVAISKEIDVSGAETLNIGKKVYYTADSSFGKNLTVTLLVGDSELTANESGYFVLPEGTTSVKVKFSTNEFVTFKYVDVQTHEHGDACASVSGEQYNVYAFNADNTACTATRYYPCGKLIKTETVNTVISGDNATFTEKGTATCTATFADSDFETQTKVIETPMKSAPDVKMLKNGASIRANAPYGIRWAAGVRAADWNKLVELYGAENVKAGVIVAPLDYVNKASEFTFAALDEKSLSYSDIVTDMFNEEANAVLSGYNGFYASLVNIKDGNLNRKFAARAYVSVVVNGETTYYYGEYSADNQARSIYEISKSVILSDTESDAVKAFATAVLNKIVCVTVDGENISIPAIEGYTSPYTASISGGVITITATDGANINDLKVICLNGKNYKPTISGNTATLVTIG